MHTHTHNTANERTKKYTHTPHVPSFTSISTTTTMMMIKISRHIYSAYTVHTHTHTAQRKNITQFAIHLFVVSIEWKVATFIYIYVYCEPGSQATLARYINSFVGIWEGEEEQEKSSEYVLYLCSLANHHRQSFSRLKFCMSVCCVLCTNTGPEKKIIIT